MMFYICHLGKYVWNPWINPFQNLESLAKMGNITGIQNDFIQM